LVQQLPFLLVFICSLKQVSIYQLGTVYAIFVGLGTAGTVCADSLLFGEPWKLAKIICIVVLLAGVVGLKLVTGEPKEQEVSE